MAQKNYPAPPADAPAVSLGQRAAIKPSAPGCWACVLI